MTTHEYNSESRAITPLTDELRRIIWDVFLRYPYDTMLVYTALWANEIYRVDIDEVHQFLRSEYEKLPREA